MDLEILYEDNHLIAVNKPAGLLSQKDASGEDSVLEHVKAYLKKKYSKPGNVFLGTVHRLDRPVSGALVMARTSKAAARLFEQFKGRSVTKVYLALVACGVERALPEEWTTLRQRVRREGDVTRVTESVADSQDAELAYRCAARAGGYALLLVRLVTGRKHQIRAQLASIGMPVAGDGKYGSPDRNADGSICLHSLFLKFSHPTQAAQVEVLAEVPPVFPERFGANVSAMELAEKIRA